ncbi:DUF4190 domain-containing protein [Nocardia nova]|uniref:DUF4190 domain-containing protein n=1 Tax=Nocardia nova TaxID=37330 RepID=A0A2S6AXE8_9NOCA|nr:DUF4190 domain-containing protein [Nocardia nova]PPJ34338.1 DUF4190 domain-containing protein [Nocardia nova]PPJ39844.1 DUF4190 domain-containing protein [Nocardia nova]
MNQPDYWGSLPEPPTGNPVEHPHATTVLILGVLSLLCCGALGPVAWVMGKRALDQIEMSGGTIGGRSQVVVGYVVGIVGTVLMVLYASIFLLMLIGGR